MRGPGGLSEGGEWDTGSRWVQIMQPWEGVRSFYSKCKGEPLEGSKLRSWLLYINKNIVLATTWKMGWLQPRLEVGIGRLILYFWPYPYITKQDPMGTSWNRTPLVLCLPFFFGGVLQCAAAWYGIRPGIEPGPQGWNNWILTTRSPGNSPLPASCSQKKFSFLRLSPSSKE